VIEARRQAYLEAMGFDVWVAKSAPPEPARLVLGPGRHSTLLVCESAEASNLPIARDISRAIGGQPVWGWPAAGDGADGIGLEQAIAEQLFTWTIVFGPLAESCLPRKGPRTVLGSASVDVTASLGELAARGQARRAFWQLLLDSQAGTPNSPPA